MKNGFKVFGTGAYSVYPRDFWQKYLDNKLLDRIDVRDPAGLLHYNSVLVGGRYAQHATSVPDGDRLSARRHDREVW